MSLYNGLPPTLVMAVPSTVLYFTAYDAIKLRLGDHLPVRRDRFDSAQASQNTSVRSSWGCTQLNRPPPTLLSNFAACPVCFHGTSRARLPL